MTYDEFADISKWTRKSPVPSETCLSRDFGSFTAEVWQSGEDSPWKWGTTRQRDHRPGDFGALSCKVAHVVLDSAMADCYAALTRMGWLPHTAS